MKRSNRSWLFFTVSTAALAASSVLVGMTNYKNPTPQPPSLVESKELAPLPDNNVEATLPRAEATGGFTAREIEAKNMLTMELNRRFTDRQNVDFGMSRVVRFGTRLHRGPTMDMTAAKDVKAAPQKTRPTKDGHWEFEIDGKWYAMEERKPLMRAENNNETNAMKLLRDGNVDVAIYTIGQFEMDKGEKPEPQANPGNSNPNYRDFSYGKGDSLRVKGPAYIHQDSAMGPRTHEMVRRPTVQTPLWRCPDWARNSSQRALVCHWEG